jgi:hypothetical protein
MKDKIMPCVFIHRPLLRISRLNVEKQLFSVTVRLVLQQKQNKTLGIKARG